MDLGKYKAVELWAGRLGGVLTTADLKVVLDERADATLYRMVGEMVAHGSLIRVKRGIYATRDAALTRVSSRIEPKSYISTGTVLASKAVIGSVPGHKVQAVKVGRPRTYRCELGTIEHLSISPDLYFGFEAIDGQLVASVEKAFLDVCYFTYHGHRFSFDPATDINLEGLDFEIIGHHLKCYDSRFVSFFHRIWGQV